MGLTQCMMGLTGNMTKLTVSTIGLTGNVEELNGSVQLSQKQQMDVGRRYSWSWCHFPHPVPKPLCTSARSFGSIDHYSAFHSHQ